VLQVRSHLQRFRAAFQDERDEPGAIPEFSLVLIEYGLWSRFEPSGRARAMQFHIDGPALRKQPGSLDRFPSELAGQSTRPRPQPASFA